MYNFIFFVVMQSFYCIDIKDILYEQNATISTVYCHITSLQCSHLSNKFDCVEVVLIEDEAMGSASCVLRVGGGGLRRSFHPKFAPSHTLNIKNVQLTSYSSPSLSPLPLSLPISLPSKLFLTHLFTPKFSNAVQPLTMDISLEQETMV